MKIKEQTRKLAAGCSKHCFEVVNRTDEVSSKHCFEVADRTDEVSNHTYGKAKRRSLKRFSKSMTKKKTNETRFLSQKLNLIRQNDITKSCLSVH